MAIPPSFPMEPLGLPPSMPAMPSYPPLAPPVRAPEWNREKELRLVVARQALKDLEAERSAAIAQAEQDLRPALGGGMNVALLALNATRVRKALAQFDSDV